THQFSHLWIDFREIRDYFMRALGSDYFENSRQATFVQQECAIRNPLGFVGYDAHSWGFTACDGPGRLKPEGNGVEALFSPAAPGVPRSAPTTARSRPGASSPRCRSRPRSSSPPC